MLIILCHIDKQTVEMQESDTRGFSLSGNVSYGKVNTKGNGFKNEEDWKEDTYDYI